MPQGAPSSSSGSPSGPNKGRLVTAVAAVAGVVVGAMTMGLIDRDDSPDTMDLRSGSGFDGDQADGNMPGFSDGDQGDGNMPGFGSGGQGDGYMPGFGDGDQDQDDLDDDDDGSSIPDQDAPSQDDGSGTGGFMPPGGGGAQGFSRAS